MQTENLSPEEQTMLALHDLILSAFREHFGEETIIKFGTNDIGQPFTGMVYLS